MEFKRGKRFLMQPRKELLDILGEDVTSVISRRKNAFSLLSKGKKGIVLFGAGNLGKKVSRVLRTLKEKPICFSDSDPNLWGKRINGLDVFSPRQCADKYGKDAVFIVTIFNGSHKFADTRKLLFSLGCKCVVHSVGLFWRHPEYFLPYYYVDLPEKIIKDRDEVLACFDLLADEQSRREFLKQIYYHLHLRLEGLTSPRGSSYFSKSIVSFLGNEIFADCGAFDGDTIRDFLQQRRKSFNKIIAIEPDRISFGKLKAYVCSLSGDLKQKIALYNCALGEHRGRFSFNCTGTTSSALGGSKNKVKCLSLRDLLKIEGVAASYVKMDIEGQEKNQLLSIKGIISRFCPVLAVCLDHNQEDIYKIPLLVKSLNSDYLFFLRRHEQECFQTVLYAVPKNRLKGRIA